MTSEGIKIRQLHAERNGMEDEAWSLREFGKRDELAISLAIQAESRLPNLKRFVDYYRGRPDLDHEMMEAGLLLLELWEIDDEIDLKLIKEFHGDYKILRFLRQHSPLDHSMFDLRSYADQVAAEHRAEQEAIKAEIERIREAKETEASGSSSSQFPIK